MVIRKKTLLAALALGSVALAAAPSAFASQNFGQTLRISLKGENTQFPAGSLGGRLSGNGNAAALVVYKNQTKLGATEVYVRSIYTNILRLADGTPDGKRGNGSSSDVSLSKDGRQVAFASTSTNLIAGDTNAKTDIFVRDMKDKVTTRVSVAGDGTQANGDSWGAQLSNDGKSVVFFSDATNLVAGGSTGTQLYVRDLSAGTTTLVTATPAGAPATVLTGGEFRGTITADISGDGRYVTFMSGYSDLVDGDTNDTFDVFVRDLSTGTTTRVSAAENGTPADSFASEPAISTDGTTIVFSSRNTAIHNQPQYIYAYKLATHKSTLISVGSDGQPLDNYNEDASVSANGRYVAFVNSAPGPGTDVTSVIVRDLRTGTSTLASVNDSLEAANNTVFWPSISNNGKTILFTSAGSNLVPEDTNDATDVFVRILP
jgi:hypothetical protein